MLIEVHVDRSLRDVDWWLELHDWDELYALMCPANLNMSLVWGESGVDPHLYTLLETQSG
jgi:hypothetical protein